MNAKMGFLFLSLFSATAALAQPSINPKSNSNDVLNLSWMNPQIAPGDDFYAYANGNWQKNNPIPPEYASWGSFNILNEQVQARIHDMLIKAAENKKSKVGSIEQKVGDFYFSGMDESTINKLGVSPLQPEFDRINQMQTLADLQHEIAHLHLIGVDAFFGFGSTQDYKHSEQTIAIAVQGGLGLPDRDYYLNDSEKFKQIRDAYVNHIAKMMELVGDSPEQAKSAAQRIMVIETGFAKASMSQVAQRDPYAVYHMMDRKQLAALTPNFSWPEYFKDIGQDKIEQLNVATVDFFHNLNTDLTKVSLADWKNYLRWHLIDGFAPYLSEPFVSQNFKMLTALTGTEKILPRWKRVVNVENGALGFAIGKMYVEQYFSATERQEVLEIIKNIRTVLRDDISTLNWMSVETRTEALKKLDLMEERVGYPTKWWDYSKLQVDRGPYVLNVINANKFLVQRDLNKIGKPIDRSEWAMTPQTINAYYDPSMNNLNLPAGILQSPFYDPKAPAAVNYGAIGFIIGHEMTHGFDDQGAQFDGNGNLKNWWKASDLSKFKKATQCIVNQFSQYVVDGDMHVQGKLVVGEATADLGGITIAYRAFQISKDYKNAKTIDGMTPEQQFFLGTAHVWAMNIRPQQIRNQVTTDPHPPAQYRVNGSLANIPQFKSAFGIADHSPMVNKNPCVIW